MKFIIIIFRFLGALAYSIIAAYLLWLLWHIIIPYTFILSWLWIILIFVFLYTAVIGLIGSAATLLYAPIMLLVKNDKWMAVFPFLLTLFFGVSSVREVWTLDMHYGSKAVIVAILLSFLIVILFSTLAFSIIKSNKLQ